MEERGFAVLLERIEQQYKLLSEQVTGMESRFDRRLQSMQDYMDGEFRDIKRGISILVRDVAELKHQSHTHP